MNKADIKLVEELKLVNEFSDSFVESLHDGLFITNPIGKIVIVNAALSQLTGFDKEDLIGAEQPYPFWPSELHNDFKRRFNTLSKDNLKEEFEVSYVHKNGVHFPVSVFSASIKNKKNEVIAYLSVVQNIDETEINVAGLEWQNKEILSILNYRKKYIDLIIEKKFATQLNDTLNNISDGFVSLDTNWCYTYVNKKAGEFLGREASSLIGKHIWTEFPDGVNLPFYKAYYKAVETQETQIIQDYYEPFDRWFENRIYPSSDGLTIYFNDITENKKNQENLRLANEFSKKLITSLRQGLVVMNIDGEIIDVNPSFCEITQFKKEELLGATAPFPFWPPESYEAIQVCLGKTLQGETGAFEFLFMRKGGERFPAALGTASIKNNEGEITAFFVTIDDISDRKNVEEKLIKNEKLFSHLTSNVPVAIFQTDKSGSCNYVNEQWVKYAGMSFENAMGFGWSNAIHPDDKERVLNEWQQSIQTNTEFISEFRFQDKKNKITWLSAKAVEIFDAQNNLYGYIGMASDITDRKNAEKHIVESKEYLDNIINNIGDPVFVKDEESHFLLANNAFYNLFKRTKEEILGKTFAENVPEQSREKYLSADREVISKGMEKINEESLTVEGGEIRYISTKKTRFIDGNGKKYLIGVIRDITKRKNAEIELEKYQHELEELVEIRTEEVNLKNDELQRMNKLFIGRELRMKELKTIIKEMKLKNDN